MNDKIRAAAARQFGRTLRAARERAGLTQPALSARSGVSVPSIARYEAEQRAPALAEALVLSQVLGFSLDDLARP